MKTINRIVSAAIAACMSLTMFAGAVELDTTAGAPEEEMKTYSGVVTVVADDGTSEEKEYEFTAPTDATQDELYELNQAAARQAAYGPQPRSFIQSEKLKEVSDVSIPKVSSELGRRISTSYIDQKPYQLEVYMYGVTGCSKVNVSIQDRDNKQQKDYDTWDVKDTGFCYATFMSSSACKVAQNHRYNFYFSGNRDGHADLIQIGYNYYTT